MISFLKFDLPAFRFVTLHGVKLLFLAAFLLPPISQSVGASETEKLHRLFEKERALYYQHNPQRVPASKRQKPLRSLASVTPQSYENKDKYYRELLGDLNDINRAELSAEDKINYDLFGYIQQQNLLTFKHKKFRIPLYSDSGFHSYLPRSWRSVRFRTVEDYDAYLDRLRDIPRYFEEHMDNMRSGLKVGYSMPKVVLDGLLPTFAAPIKESPAQSEFYGPFKSMPKTISRAEQDRLRDEAAAVIGTIVNGAYRKLDQFMRLDYYPAAKDSLGARDFPNGPNYYADMVKYYTSLDITPEEVHALGLKEVARIRSEMQAVIKDAKFDGSFKEFLAFLRTDPQFYAKSEKDLLMFASYVAKKVDGRLPKFFGKLPRQPYGIEAVPASIAPNYTTGRYSGSPLDAPRGGYYWVNTYALDKRPLYAIPALTMHEAAPGHHLQSALSKEMDNVPAFRKGYYPNAYGEGWGLYSEKLGIELGAYETPYEDFGRLSYEMWRACRLVIDTGIHAFGWSRDQSIKLLEENSALSALNIRTEVDRYISWPGQALAYKMGELKLLELRNRAEKELGEDFDIRAFHDRVLTTGGLPLDLLDRLITDWIAAQKEK